MSKMNPEHDRQLDPVSRSLMVRSLCNIAEEVGHVLVRGAYSANIKERRDCSAALFDNRGMMIAQAEHIPVHLGALPMAIEAVLAANPQPGDVFVLNDPYQGGSHLPDITMAAPIVFEGNIVAYAATRAHHADVGGMYAGSMPSDSVEIFQEGIRIPPVRLVRNGVLNLELLSLLVANVRTPRVSQGDYRAQAAAVSLGERRLLELIERHGIDTVTASFAESIAYAEDRTRAAIRGIPDGTYRAKTEIEGDGVTDSDITIAVTVTVAGDQVAIDFDGTDPAAAGNVNCPLAVTKAACYFVVRTLIPDDIPTNAGVFAPVSVSTQPGTVVNAVYPSAVCAGNVETSSRIADAIMSALSETADLPAAGQGTMNVLTMGGRAWSYLETLGGGQGASRFGDGLSGIHVGMTNTLNTPIEALELTYPLRVERYELLYGSGGGGLHQGGDGLVREIRALEKCSASILSDRRRHQPAGTHGGQGGRLGANRVNGSPVPGKSSFELNVGDVVTIETPGGGGWGTSDEMLTAAGHEAVVQQRDSM